MKLDETEQAAVDMAIRFCRELLKTKEPTGQQAFHIGAVLHALEGRGILLEGSVEVGIRCSEMDCQSVWCVLVTSEAIELACTVEFHPKLTHLAA